MYNPAGSKLFRTRTVNIIPISKKVRRAAGEPDVKIGDIYRLNREIDRYFRLFRYNPDILLFRYNCFNRNKSAENYVFSGYPL